MSLPLEPLHEPWKGKEGLPFTRTRGLLAYWRGPISEDARRLLEGNHPISEDARRLLGREQLAAGESTGTCGVMANHTKSITQTLPAPKVNGACVQGIHVIFPSLPATLTTSRAQESSQVAAFVSAGFDAVLGD